MNDNAFSARDIVSASILLRVIFEGTFVLYAASLFFIGAIVTGVFAYTCLMHATRTSDASVVRPFRSIRLLFGIALGFLIFGERLTLSTMTGSGQIVLSGLSIPWRKKRELAPLENHTARFSIGWAPPP